MEAEGAWKEHSSLTSVFLETKRYKIVATESFNTKEDALNFISNNMPFKMRPKTAGCVILSNESQLTNYLFFTQNTHTQKR